MPISRAEARRLALAVLAAERARGVSLSIAFVGPAAIRRLNRDYLGRDGETDVVAFALDSGVSSPRLVGDIYICPRVAAARAREFGEPAAREVRRLVVHGVLHVLGYDHEEGPGRTRGRMWRRQETLLSRYARPR